MVWWFPTDQGQEQLRRGVGQCVATAFWEGSQRPGFGVGAEREAGMPRSTLSLELWGVYLRRLLFKVWSVASPVGPGRMLAMPRRVKNGTLSLSSANTASHPGASLHHC